MPKLLEPQLTDAVKTRFASLVANTTTRLAVNPAVLSRSVSLKPTDLGAQTPGTDEFATYISGICRAIVGAHENWRQRAFLKGVQINGITANGGSINGPLLSEIVNATGPTQGLGGNAFAYTRAIGDGLAASWREWEQSVRVPALAWYPNFAAFPAPQAPPVANIPTPMSKLIWSPSPLSPDYIKANIARRLTKPGAYSEELFASIADGFSKAVAAWLPTQMVSGVLGKGPIPAFAPPYVPVGPVVGGDNISSGPHFAT